MKLRTTLGLSAAAVALATSAVSHANDVPEEQSSAAPQASSSVTVGEIVVTAQLRSQSVQKVPASVSVLDDTLLVNRGTTSLVQVTQLAPALRIAPLRSQTFIFLRGVGQSLSEPNADPQIAANVNGVYVPSEMNGGAFFDVERIEVVPGPQGTLYGRNAAGGVINLFTKRPGQEMAANGFIEVGNYDSINALIGVNVPLTDTLAIRAAATLNRHDGWYTNGMQGLETSGGRLTAVWEPDDATTITAIGAYVHEGGIPDTGQLRPSSWGDPREMRYDPDSIDAGSNVRSTMASLEINRDLTDGIRLTYLGGYNRFNSHVISSFFPIPVGNIDVPFKIINDQRNRSTSQEVRLNISNDRLDAVLGAYYFWNNSFYSVWAATTFRQMTAKSEGQAAFGQATYSLTDGLRLTGGLRYSHTKKSLDGSTQNPPTTGTILPFIGEKSESRLDWRAGVEFDTGPASMLYANAQTGFTPGGFSGATSSTTSTDALSFEKVTLLAYSAGMKNRLLDNRLTLNFEGFYYDYKNYQVASRDPATLQATVRNAEKARIYGAQIDADWAITPDDRLTLGVVYTNAKVNRLILPVPQLGPGAVPITDLSGFSLPNAPKWTINASFEHIFRLGSGAQIEALVNTQYSSGYWLFYWHPDNGYQDAKSRTDFTLTYRPENKRWSISGWVRNIEDSTVYLFGGAPAPVVPGNRAILGMDAPRTYGGRLTFEF